MNEDDLKQLHQLSADVTRSDVSILKQELPIAGEEKLSRYERFTIRGKQVLLDTIAKYNSTTRAVKMASIVTGITISTIELKKWQEEDPVFNAEVLSAKQAFADTLREEVADRAVYGVDKPVFDKAGNHVDTVKVKSDKLLERMLSANCDEYKTKDSTALSADGNIVFNVVNFSSEMGKIIGKTDT